MDKRSLEQNYTSGLKFLRVKCICTQSGIIADSSNYTVENISHIYHTKYINAESWSSISLKRATLKINGMKILHSVSNISYGPKNVLVARISRGYWNKTYEWLWADSVFLFSDCTALDTMEWSLKGNSEMTEPSKINNAHDWFLCKREERKSQSSAFGLIPLFLISVCWRAITCYQSSDTGFLTGSRSVILHVTPGSPRPDSAHFHRHR